MFKRTKRIVFGTAFYYYYGRLHRTEVKGCLKQFSILFVHQDLLAICQMFVLMLLIQQL